MGMHQNSEYLSDLRNTMRIRVDYPMLSESRQHGEIILILDNLSPHGLMVRGSHPLLLGERLIFHIPGLGRIEGHMLWQRDNRTGFQFERIVQMNELEAIVAAILPHYRKRSGSTQE